MFCYLSLGFPRAFVEVYVSFTLLLLLLENKCNICDEDDHVIVTQKSLKKCKWALRTNKYFLVVWSQFQWRFLTVYSIYDFLNFRMFGFKSCKFKGACFAICPWGSLEHFKSGEIIGLNMTWKTNFKPSIE
jgi:hypothetical protein